MIDIRDFLLLSANLLGIIVIIEKLMGNVRNWDGSPELKTINMAMSTLDTELKRLNETVGRLNEALVRFVDSR